MTQTLPAEQITLYDLAEKFNLQEVKEQGFFAESYNNLPNLTPYEQQRLERVKAAYHNLAQRAVLENTVKLAIIGSLDIMVLNVYFVTNLVGANGRSPLPLRHYKI